MSATDLLPKRPETFFIRGWKADEEAGAVSFHYGFDNGLEFCEQVNFGRSLPSAASALRQPFDAALDALAAAMGASYYKAFVPKTLVVEGVATDADQLAFFKKLYVNGLAEFAYRNGLGDLRHIEFASTDGPARGSPPQRAGLLPAKTAVLIGGGKDSLVSVEALRQAREDMVLFAVNPKKPIIDCVETSGLPSIFISRQLDKGLFDLNAKGALNGHVPITAIVSLIAAAAAYVHGYNAIVLSNERSANEGNVTQGDFEINHQYSKSIDFESDLRRYIARYVDGGLEYFSLLRPLSEFHIAQLFAKSDRYDACFTSCNRSFKLNQVGGPPPRWCCDCPKCRFTFLILATAMAPERLTRIFGRDLLNESQQIEGYLELTGLSGHKPWECVGELAESGAAFILLSRRPEWASHAVVKELAPRLKTLLPGPEPVLQSLVTPSAHHHLPDRFKGMLDGYLGRS
jgi:hypothetical protein